jgi:hypothetical protein
MPVDYQVLQVFGTTNARLKEIFTAEATQMREPVKGESKEEKKVRLAHNRQLKADCETRERFQRKIQARLDEGISRGLKNWRLYAAVDMAWDSNVITKQTIPLQLYAQGKIDVESAITTLSSIPGGKQYISMDENGKPKVDVPKFIETTVNLLRSVINRRHSAQKNKYNNAWPYYAFESRSTGLPAKLRADVLSQLADIMVDQFGHRHHDGDVMRNGMLYARALDFVRSSWEVEKAYRRSDVNIPASRENMEEVITKQGVAFINPHPSRVFFDNAYPITSLNTDTGCEYCGFWDLVRWSAVADNPDYINKQAVGWTSKMWGNGGFLERYSDYFAQYQYTIVPPTLGTTDPSAANDRQANIGLYANTQDDSSVLLANYYERLVPKDYGMGDYPFPVWVRLVVSEDGTVLFPEIMPSTPAASLEINGSDNREVNVSLAMELLGFQDQMTNLVTQMLLLCQIDVFKVIGLNSDTIDAASLAEAKKQLSGRNWSGAPLIVTYSLAKLIELNINPTQAVGAAVMVSEARQQASIASCFDAMMKLMTLVEKMIAMSPHEQGQPAPREISATEVTEISNTTSSVYSSISDDIDEYRAAKKRIIYESATACYRGNIEAPVKDRYTPKTIAMAGFMPKAGEDEDWNIGANKPRRTTVIGSARALVHDYIFTSRDGAERPVNTQAANTLVQLIGQVLAVPQVAQAMGKEKIYELFNEVFRLSGAGVDLNLSLKEGEDDALGEDELATLKQSVEELIAYSTKMAQQLSQTAQSVAQQEQVNAQQEEAIQGMVGIAQRLQKAVEDIEDLKQQGEVARAKVAESLKYADAPDDVKRQIEQVAGFTPSTLPPVTT